jgi:ubiquinone biosynthesis protein
LFQSLFHLARLARVGFVTTREGVLSLIDPKALPPLARVGVRLARLIERPGAASSAERLAAALTRLGPSHVKLGQFLATRPDVVGTRVAKDLEALQDRMPPFPDREARAIVAAAFGRPLEETFASFGPPVAAASIAQVHKASVVEDGIAKAVAVKVIRPGIDRRFRVDLDAMMFAARLAERSSAEGARLRPTEVVGTLVRSVRLEMDFRLEAAALAEMAENTKGDPDFRVPTVDWERTSRDVLTLEWIDGIKLADRAALEAAGHDLPKLGRVVIQSFLRHALRDGFFHADMHPGNLFVDPEGRLVAVDFGITGRIGPKERRFLAEILLGFITRNYRRVAEVHFEAGYVPPIHAVDDFAQAIRAIGEPIHSRTADQISMAKLLTLLFEITALFDMKTRTELVMLQKTMVVVEGVGRALDPRLDMWSTAEPVVREWIERNLGPVGVLAQAGQGTAALGRFGIELPALLERGARVMAQLDDATRDGLALAPATVRDIGRAEGRGNRWLALGVWALVGLLAVALFG